MRPHYRLIDDLVASDKTLAGNAKLLYGLIYALANECGHCYASNDYLAEEMGISSRTLQRYLQNLVQKKYIIIELETNTYRKIWTFKTWAVRDRYVQPKHERKPKSRGEFNQRFTTYDKSVVGVRQNCHPPIYKEENKNLKLEQRHRDRAPPNLSIEGGKQQATQKPAIIQVIPQQMTGDIPTPGPKAMVKETKALLEDVIHYKGTRNVIHPEDKKYFYGFSPSVILEAFRKTQGHAGKGKNSIHFLTRYIYVQCCKIRKE